MKNKKILSVLLAVMLIFCAFALTGCKDTLGKYDDSISELRLNLFECKKEEAKLTAITGMREQPFSIDGVAHKKQAYTVVMLTPKEFNPAADLQCAAEIGGKLYTGKLIPHPFGESYSLEIGEAVAVKEFKVTITDTRADAVIETDYILTSLLSDATISAAEALDIALAKLSTEVKSLKSGGKLNAEIFIRIIENPIDAAGGYFWYVAFEGRQGESYAVMMHPETKEIIAVRS